LSRVLPWLVLVVLVLAIGASIAWRALPEEEAEPDVRSLRLEVVNGSGTPRAGRAVADELQMRGLDVYAVRTESRRAARTAVVDLREHDGRNAKSVARVLSVQRHWRKLPLGPRYAPDTRVEIDSARYLEVRLVVGDDYRIFFPNVVPLY